MTCVELGGGCLQLVVGAVCLDAGVREEKEEIGEERGGNVWFINFYWWNHRQKYSIGDSIGNSNGEWVMSLYEDLGLNHSVILWVKSPVKTSRSLNCFFFSFKILYIPSVIQSVYTDNIIPSVYSDRITDGFTSVGKYHRKLPT